jgi:hypothetical protein
VSEFEKTLPLIGELVTVSERLAGAGRVSTTLAELAESLRRPAPEIIRAFEVLNVQVASWSEPTLYRLEQIIEAGTRHEVAQRM